MVDTSAMFVPLMSYQERSENYFGFLAAESFTLHHVAYEKSSEKVAVFLCALELDFRVVLQRLNEVRSNEKKIEINLNFAGRCFYSEIHINA